MAIQVDFDESIDSIVIRATSVVGCDEILTLRDQIISHPNFRNNINQLFDLSEGQLSVNSDELVKIASYFKEKSVQLGYKRKLALAVSRAMDFGRMRQYEVFFDAGPDVLVQAFPSLQEARAWLLE